MFNHRSDVLHEFTCGISRMPQATGHPDGLFFVSVILCSCAEKY